MSQYKGFSNTSRFLKKLLQCYAKDADGKYYCLGLLMQMINKPKQDKFGKKETELRISLANSQWPQVTVGISEVVWGHRSKTSGWKDDLFHMVDDKIHFLRRFGLIYQSR